MKGIPILLITLLLGLVLIYADRQKGSSNTLGQITGAPTEGIPKTSSCVAENSLPDKSCTPGATMPGVTKEQVCTVGYSSSVRNVPVTVKSEIYKEYGIETHVTGEYEIDHLISLELGGSNDKSNLWPEAAEPKPGYHEKDQVENYLHTQVCNGMMNLVEAQQKIATNWLQVYQKMPK
ncbi:HNH endonuclease [Patescibacteria group bacterium]|nr:HNH endonuclease [Patescibacteria group bacterium]